MERETLKTRVRGNFTTTAKGLAQLDITAEAETSAEMETLLNEAFEVVMGLLKKNSIRAAHEVEP